ncbi:hypothetical protein [Streptomyces corynorhini]|uniref:Sporulation delaying protein family toxin n=1 Tax=Streptomyces corynorhini TaxID=2282652 RepID=A0A370AY37_9ACTN|nr:hypothetical protein [Streptomyces corynorhini]RDG34508.1 hypothetical protein DVH02_30250 [Streptomyces corynorhini]
MTSKRVAAGVAVSLLIAGVGPTVTASAAPSKQEQRSVTAAAKTDGVAVYEGLFFGQGAVAKAHPDLVLARGKTDSAESAKVAAKVIGTIEAKDATFFDRFGAAMQSGNDVLVNRVLAEANTKTVAAMRAEFGDPVTADDNLGAKCVVLVLVLGVGNVVYFVNAYESANVAYQVNWVDSASPKAGDTITRERWVHQAASALRA